MLDYQLTYFNNGLKLITAPLENTKAVTVMFLVGVGSRYEERNLNGISHFLEHIFFKGTKKRPTTLDIAKELDAVGASYNAFTGEEYTGFYVRAASEHFDLALDVLTDIIYNSKFDETEIEKEKGVIAEEINLYQDNPQSHVVDLAKGLFYGDSPLGRSIAGKKETIKTFTQKDFLDYRDLHYSPNNMIVAVAGGKNNTDWQKKIHEYFDKIPQKKDNEFEKIVENQKEPKVLVHHKKTDQAHLVLGFRTIPRTSEERWIVKVLNNLLGETMSSRLFTEVREKKGLAYYVSSEMVDFQDCGAVAASAGVDISRVEEAVEVILDEFKKLKNIEIEEEEINRGKENLKGRLYLGLEESFAVADYLVVQELFWEKIDDPDELVEKFNKVTSKEIKDFAQKYFVKENLNLVIIGPFAKHADKDKFKKILETF